MLGRLIDSLDDPETALGLLAALEEPLLVEHLALTASSTGQPVPDVIASTVRGFLETASDDHWVQLIGIMNRAEDRDPNARDLTFYQEGRKVFKEVVPMAAAHIEAHLARLGLEPTRMRRFWLHQANQGMNQLVIKKLVGGEAGSEVAPLILDEYANTASAGSIIAFHHHRADLQAGDAGVICSFGAGYSIGSVVVQKC